MKKYLKLSLITIFIFLIGILNVSAEENVELVKVELQEKSEYVEINEETTFNDNKIKTNISFYGEGDYVVYNLTLKNNDDKDYKIDEIVDTNESEYLKFEYLYEDEVIKGNSEKEIKLKITYISRIPYDAVLNPDNTFTTNSEVSISVKLNDDIPVDNPTTFDNAKVYLVLEIIGVVGLSIIFIKLKKKNAIMLLILTILLIPKSAKAKIELQINFSFINEIKVQVNYLNKDFKTLITDPYTKIEFVKRGSFPTDAIDLSQEEDETIMGWVEDDTLYIGSKYMIFFPNDSTSLLSKNDLEEINFNDRVDTTFVNNMRNLFCNDVNIDNLDISSFRTGNVTIMYGMFNNLKKVTTLDVSNIDTSKVTDFIFMFNGDNSLTELNLSSWNTSSASTMYSMFYGCSSIKKLILDNWDLSNNPGMYSMFYGMTSLEELSMKNMIIPTYFGNGIFRSLGASLSPIKKIDVTGWDLSRTESLNALFANNSSLEEIVGLNTWDTSNVQNMNEMFMTCPKLKKLDLSSFDMTNVTNVTRYLYQSFDLEEIITPKVYPSSGFSIDLFDVYKDEENNYYAKLTNEVGNKRKIIGTNSAMIKKGSEVNTTFKVLSESGSSYNSIDNTTQEIRRLAELPEAGIPDQAQIISTFESNNPVYVWYDDEKIYYYTDADMIFLNNDSSSLFYNMRMLHNIDLEIVDSTFVKYMSSMFYNVGYNWDGDLEFDLSNFNFLNVDTMSSAFYGVGYLSENVSLTIEDLNLINATTIDNLFNRFGYNAKNVELNIKNWYMPKVNNVNSLFSFTGYNAENLEINASGWDFVVLTSLNYSFNGVGAYAKNISIDLKNWSTSTVTDMSRVFISTYGKDGTLIIDVTGWDLSNVETMGNMFEYFGSNSYEVQIIGLDTWDTSNVQDMSYTFYSFAKNAKIIEMDISNWDVSNVNNMKAMFCYSMNYFEQANIGDFSNWDTTNVSNMDYMFNNFGSTATGTINVGTFKIYNASTKYIFSYGKGIRIVLNCYYPLTLFTNMFNDSANLEGNEIVVNYTADVTNIDEIIATKSANSNVIKGELLEE